MHYALKVCSRDGELFVLKAKGACNDKSKDESFIHDQVDAICGLNLKIGSILNLHMQPIISTDKHLDQLRLELEDAKKARLMDKSSDDQPSFDEFVARAKADHDANTHKRKLDTLLVTTHTNESIGNKKQLLDQDNNNTDVINTVISSSSASTPSTPMPAISSSSSSSVVTTHTHILKSAPATTNVSPLTQPPKFQDFLTGDELIDYGVKSGSAIPEKNSATATRYLTALAKYVLVDDVKIPPITCAALLECNPMLRFMPQQGYEFGGRQMISECENELYTTVRRATNGILNRLDDEKLNEQAQRLYRIVKRHAVCFLTYAKLFGDTETAAAIRLIAPEKPFRAVLSDKAKDNAGSELEFISTILHFCFAYRVACELAYANPDVKPLIVMLRAVSIDHYKKYAGLFTTTTDDVATSDHEYEESRKAMIRRMRWNNDFWADAGPNGYLSALELTLASKRVL